MPGTGPWAAVRPSARAARENARAARRSNAGGSGARVVWIGPWALTTNTDGHLVARHENGAEHVIATNEEGPADG